MTSARLMSKLVAVNFKKGGKMNAMSNNWKPEILSSGKAGDGHLYSTSAGHDREQEELTGHIADKKTKQVGRMVEAMVIMFVGFVAVFAIYKVFTSF